jgi:hypothetical protein
MMCNFLILECDGCDDWFHYECIGFLGDHN